MTTESASPIRNRNTKVLVRGIGDVGSAVAHALFGAGFAVVIHDEPQPTHSRRQMAFTDALFDGKARLAGLDAMRIDDLLPLQDFLCAREGIAASMQSLEALLVAFTPDVLVDARMRKRQIPEVQRHMAALTIGLGANFTAGHTTHMVIETAWGEQLGKVISEGAAAVLSGGPRLIGGYGTERVIYAPHPGVWASSRNIGDTVSANQLIGHVDATAIIAALSGRIRGLTRHCVRVNQGTKIVEIDPRGDDAVFTGIGERPAQISAGILKAIEIWSFRNPESRNPS